MMNRESIAKYV